MINSILGIITGALIGCGGGVIMRTNSWQGLIADIVAGILGAIAGDYFLNPLLHVSKIDDGSFSVPALLVSLGCAVILLVIFMLFRTIKGLLQRNLFFSFC